MLKVNEEKILADYNELVEKKAKGLAAVEADAKAYAIAHGYDDEKTAKFVTFLQGLQGSGLSDKELEKLDILGSYVEEIEEKVATETVAQADTFIPNMVNNTVNVI